MNDMTLADDTGTIEIEISNDRVESLRISSQWRSRFEPATLAEAISQLIRDALPPREAPGEGDAEPEPDRELPLSAIPSYIAEMREGRKAMRRYLARLRAGEVHRAPEVRHEDDAHRVNVSIVGGRFDALYLNPEWAAEASLQALSDTILSILPDPLVAAPEVDADIAEARRHYAAARAHLVEI